MRRILLLSGLLFTASLSFGNELIPVSSDQQKNLNETAFIKAMDEANNGKIPFPFENLIESLGSKIDDTNLLLVPKGRSLVKEKADYKNPRIIVAPFDPKTKTGSLKKFGFDSSELFIGYAPNSKSLEVISFNRQTNQFDFFVVENYEQGKTPRVVSNPALCLSCHQNRAPIFPQFPWTEMTGEAGKHFLKNGISSDCSKDNFDNDIVNKVIAANSGRKSIEGISLEKYKNKSACEASTFDANVTVASGMIETQTYCEALCDKKDKNCMLNFLKLKAGLNLSPEELLSFGNIEEKVAKISAPSSHHIPNRDPYSGQGFKSLIASDQIEAINLEYILKGEMGTYYDATYKGFSSMFNKGGLHAFDFPVADSAFVNPATPRPSENTIDILKAKLKFAKTEKEKIDVLVERCLSPDLFIGESEKPLSSFDLLKIIQNPKIRDALNSWPGTYKLESMISSLVNGIESLDEDCISKDPILAVYAYKDITDVASALNKDKVERPKALFQKYCSQCHDPDTGFIALPLKSLDDMANYKPRFSDKAPLERLTLKIMPPASAPQPTDEERKELVNVLKELKK